MDAINTQANGTIAERLAALICAFDKSRLTAKALSQAKMCILDTIGVTLAGIPEPCTQILLKTPGVADAPGPALIVGTERRTSALDATLINGTASHALDYDDFSGVLGGHHSVPLVPMLVALAEDRRFNGEQLVLSYIIGVETEIRLSRAVNFHHYDKGWHPTATLGVIGAAAAASHILGLGPERTATALAIAASLASGIKANFGTMVKPLHIGQCGRNGLLAALLAEGGYDAASNAYEHHQGFLNVFNGPGTFDIEKAFANWGEPLEIEADTIGLKQFPCCGSTHPAITMMLDLVREEKITPNDVAAIAILPHGRRLRHTNTPHPTTPLEAKFSVQYVVARALVDQAVRLKHFESQSHAEPAIAALLAKTQARPHPDMADDAAEQWGAEVIVTTNDGRTLSRRVENLVGRGGKHAMRSDEMWEKFNDCAKRVLPRDQVAPLFERLETVEKMTDVSQLTRLMRANPSDAAPPRKVTFAPASAQAAPETTWVP
jgi:2-methylcitrate dehydratase PrpD